MANARRTQGDTIGSELASDERVVAFDTAAWRDPVDARWRVPLHVWVFEPERSFFRRRAIEAVLARKYQIEPSSAEEESCLADRIGHFLVDNERGKRVRVELGHETFEVGATRPDGHARAVVEPGVAADPRDDVAIELAIRALHPSGGGDGHGIARLVPPRGLSVISDVDDTVKLTGVHDRRSLLERTFLRPFEAVPGMVDLYRRWHAAGAVLHFVSSSPWQLYLPLHAFAREAGFPPATFHLKKVRFRDASLLDLFVPGTATKPRQIEPILRAYPERAFVLVGDTGEHDPEVYAALLRRYPRQIQRVYLRDVTGTPALRVRLGALFAGLPPDRWQVFTDPSELERPST